MSIASTQVTIICTDDLKDVISAELDIMGFDGIWDEGDRLQSYIASDRFIEKDLYQMLSRYGMENSYSLQAVEEKNWNAIWESNFDPFRIEDQLIVRATFHPGNTGHPYEIIIDPRMSFGTGHHETTELVLRMMLKSDLVGKSVLDMGCGTGVLAILAEKMGASQVLAVDNDLNSVENTADNLKYNQTSNVECIHGGIEVIEGEFDVILSNITKNINIMLLPELAKHLVTGGYIVISGFLDFDREEMVQAAQNLGLFLESANEKNKWQCLKLRKR